ncbi:MAG: hypothetical protein WCI94_04920 [Rhodospirillales bacterium]
MSSLEAIDRHGVGVLHRIAEEGSASLIDDRAEPSRTIRERRIALGIGPNDLAAYAGLEPSAVEKAEMPGIASSSRDLDRFAQALALDEYKLGKPGTGGDELLAAALSNLSTLSGGRQMSVRDRLAMTSAVWVIGRQADLASRIALHEGRAIVTLPEDGLTLKTGPELAPIIRSAASSPFWKNGSAYLS